MQRIVVNNADGSYAIQKSTRHYAMLASISNRVKVVYRSACHDRIIMCTRGSGARQLIAKFHIIHPMLPHVVPQQVLAPLHPSVRAR